jgi:tRNA(Ile)-lysidine synthase
VLEQVHKAISRYNMLPSGARVVAAVSGGPDSVCLLHVLAEIGPRAGVSLAVAHFNHKLRGAESEEDERFVAEIAARFGLPFHRAEADVAAVKDNLEQAARRARRAYFAELRKTGIADRVALGHTRDDQAETVLFRLLRGSGLAGLAGIYPATADGYIRPFIDVTRRQIEEYLRARGIPWREDSSNLNPRFARNRIRQSLMPQLAREWNPRIGEILAHLGDVAHEEERWRHGETERLASVYLRRHAGGIEMQTGILASLPRAVSRRLIRRAIAEIKGDLRRVEFEHIERVLGLAEQPEGGGRLRLPGFLEVRRSFDWIRIASLRNGPGVPAIPLVVVVPGTYAGLGGGQIHFEVLPNGTARRYAPKDATLKAAELNLRRLPAALELRGWRPGDHYRPEGQIRDQKIKEMFQRARVPSWRRPSWPIVSSGDKILWVREFGAAAEFAAGSETGPVLRVWETET